MAFRVGALMSLLFLLLACTSETIVAPPPAGFAAGQSDRIVVYVLDEVSRRPILGAEVSVGSAGEGTTDAGGRLEIATTDPLTSVRASAPGWVPEQWLGVSGRSIVLPLARHVSPAATDVTVAGADAGWSIVATSPARVLHAVDLGPAAAEPCLLTAGACTVSVAAEPDATLFAFRVDGAGRPEALRVLGALTSGADLASAVELPITELAVGVPDPGPGATAVVGVPGFAFGGRVAVFDWPLDGDPIAGGTLHVPDTQDAMGSAWGVFSTELEDGSRSVLLQRGVIGSFASWDGWLDAPTLAGDAISAPSEAELVAVAWRAGDGTLLRHDLIFAAGLVGLLPPAGATSARLRAIDTSLGAGGFDLDLGERSVTRFAERVVPLR